MLTSIKVLLVQLPYKKRVREPIGLAYIASALRCKGVFVRILCETDIKEINEKLINDIAAEYDVVGFSATTPTFEASLRIARLIKESLPSVCITLGGYHGTMFHEYIMKHHSEFDVIVRGEGEDSFIEYLYRRYVLNHFDDPIPGVSHRFGEKIIIGPKRELVSNLDLLPTPAVELLPPRNEFPLFYDHISGSYVTKASLVSSRGCPGKCGFCSIINFYGSNRVRFHSAKRILDDVKKVISDLGVRAIHFSDDNFLASIPRAERIMKGISELGLNVLIKFSARADQIIRAEKLFPAFIEYGLRMVEVGIENFSQTVLDRYQKGVTVEENVRALSLLAEFKIQAVVDFIMFDPWTSLKELEDNLNVFKNNFPPGFPYRSIIFNYLMLLPGTPLFDRAIESKLYTGDPYCYPKLIFQNTDVEDIYTFLRLCKKKSNSLIKELQEKKTTKEPTIELTQKSNFLSFLQHRDALSMLEQVIIIKKAYVSNKMPQVELDRILKNYLNKISAYHEIIENLVLGC